VGEVINVCGRSCVQSSEHHLVYHTPPPASTVSSDVGRQAYLRIIESSNGLGWKGPYNPSTPTPAMGWLPPTRSGCPGPHSAWPWWWALCSLCQHLTTLWVKNFLLIGNLHLPSFSQREKQNAAAGDVCMDVKHFCLCWSAWPETCPSVRNWCSFSLLTGTWTQICSSFVSIRIPDSAAPNTPHL